MLKIYSEFSPLMEVLVHTGSNAIDISLETYQTLVPPHILIKHPETQEVKRNKLMANVAQLHKLLESKGVTLRFPQTIDDAICQVFTRDPSFVIGDTLYLASMKDDYRACERPGLQALSHMAGHHIVDFEQGESTIEGGDVMVMSSSLVLVGIGQTSSNRGVAALHNHLINKGSSQLVRINHEALHLDCCLAPLPNGNALVVKELIPKPSLDILQSLFNDLILLDHDEATNQLAANILWLNPQEVISNSRAPKTNALLTSLGYTVHALDFSGVTPMWGGIRCVTSPLRRSVES